MITLFISLATTISHHDRTVHLVKLSTSL